MSRVAGLKPLGKLIKDALTGKGRLEAEKGLDETLGEVRNRPEQSIADRQAAENLPDEPPPSGLPAGATPQGNATQPQPDIPTPEGTDAPGQRLGDNPNDPLNVTPIDEAGGRSIIEAADQAPEELTYSNLNRVRIETEGDVGGVIDELIRIKKTQGEEIGPKETFEGVRKRATKLSMRNIKEKANTRSPLNIEEMRYAREVEADLLSNLREEAVELKQTMRRQGALTPEVELQFREKAAKVAALSRYIAGEKRRTAQLLASFRDVAGNGFLREVQRDDILNNMNQFGSPTKIGNYLDNIISANSVEQALKAADPYKPAKLAGRFMANVWFNAVLSKFAVAKAGIGGLALGKGLFPYEQFIASQISRAVRITGENREMLPAHQQQVRAGEAMIEAMGFFQGLRDAFGPIAKHLKDPEYNLGRVAFGGDDTLTTNLSSFVGFEENPYLNVAAQAVDAAVQNGSRRLLAVTDMVVKSVLFQQKVKAFAFRIAANEGINDVDALKTRMNEVIEQMDDETFERAFLAGQDATLTQRLSDPSEAAVKFINKVPGAKFFAPFTRTMLAGTELALERMPGLGLAMPRVKKAIAEGGAARDEAFSKQVSGMQILGLGAYMAMNGEAYSGAMLNKEDKYSRMGPNIYPNSILTDEGSYQIHFLSPIHELFFVGAMMGEVYQFINEEIPPEDPRYQTNIDLLLKAAPAALWTFVESTLNTSIGRNIRELVEALDDPAKYGERKTVKTITPLFQVWGQSMGRRMVDSTRRRKPEGVDAFEDMMFAIKDNTPGLSDDLPPNVGLFGEERPEYGMSDLFNWAPNSPESDLWELLFRNNINLRLPRPEQGLPVEPGKPGSNKVPIHLDKVLRPEEFKESYKEDNPQAAKPGYAYYRFSRIRGELYKQFLRNAMAAPAIGPAGIPLDQYPEGEADNDDMIWTQGDVIAPVIREANKAAKEIFMMEMQGALENYQGKVIEQMQAPRERKGFVPGNVKREAEKIRAQQPEF